MQNPYQSPQVSASPTGGEGLLPLPPRAACWAVSQVRWVAILMAVQGTFELLFGLGSAGMAIMTAVIIASPGVFNKRPGAPDPATLQLAVYYYIAFAIIALAAAGLHLIAAWRNYSFHGHTLGVVALGSGVLQVVGFCCAPTGIVLAIYGLIVYLNPEVSHAFRLAESGHSVEAVQSTFS